MHTLEEFIWAYSLRRVRVLDGKVQAWHQSWKPGAYMLNNKLEAESVNRNSAKF